MKGKHRKRAAARRAAHRSERYLAGGKRSRYARKVEWLRTNGREWGFNVSEPKPWK